jgi:hypothetical protein
MSTIPLPALAVKPPDQPDVVGGLSKLLALRNMQQDQQLKQAEIAASEQQQQLRDQQIKDQQATTSAMKAWDGKSYDDLSKSVLDNGGSATAAQNVQMHGLNIKKQVSDIAAQDATTGSKNLETFIGTHKAVGDALEPLVDPKIVSDADLHQKAMDTVAQLHNAKIIGDGEAQQAAQVIQTTQDPAQLRSAIDTIAKTSMGAKAIAEQHKTEAETAASNAKAALDNANSYLAQNKADVIKAYQQNPNSLLKQVDAIASPTGPNAVLNRRAKAQIQFAMQNGDIEGAKEILKQAGEQVGAIEKDVTEATSPTIRAGKAAQAKADAQARQEVSQGDPNDAGAMLAKGDLTLADLKSRGTTPDYITKAVAAAQKVNKDYNPADEVIAESVAKSPAANQFFGSANSLIAKGGTLDQLQEISKNIPQHDFPVLNTVDDWQQLARGKGPLAGYAAKVLGVADDYSKVMGGGTGSDSSREQALKLFAAGASPEMRQQAIDSTRDAVQSQRDSRIGKNQFLQRQYGVEVSKGSSASSSSAPKTPPQGATHIGVGSIDKKKHYLDAQGHDLGPAE